jgi:metal-responsive CopG/Arc/MetJ family transcriptional regulator
LAKETKKRGRPRTGRIAVNITLPEAIRDELERVAQDEQTAMSEIIERLLRRYLKARREKPDHAS